MEQEKYSSAYLFSGPSGTGKTTLSRIFAKAVLCDNPSKGNPCNSCESCLLFDKEQNFGYMELDSASVGGKDTMISLRDEGAYQTLGKKKIIYLDESHDITKQGQDALLKQTEQCPDHLIYIFATTDPDKMKPTLRQRCMEFQILKVKPSSICQRLQFICEKEGLEVEPGSLEFVSEQSRGHVRNALRILEKVSYYGPITNESVQQVSSNYDEEICNLICNLGTDISESINCCKTAISRITVQDLYGMVIEMLSDTAQVLNEFNDFTPRRLVYLNRIKDIHGYKVIEFLNYLLGRDKFIDRVGLRSDIILLHYKFASGSFTFQPPVQPQSATAQSQVQKEPILTASETTSDENSLSYTQLTKMGTNERNRVLRDHRNSKIGDNTKEEARVPSEWPLPKEESLGENSFDDEELSPEKFSSLLVGGRGGGI